MDDASIQKRSKLQIPMSSPDLTDVEREAVAAVLRTPVLSMGSRIEAFETGMAKFTGAAHAIAVSSGTAGLHLCTIAAGIGEGDLVITTPFSFVASANVLLYERAIPVFVDVDPKTGNIDPDETAAAAAAIVGNRPEAKRWLPRNGLPPSARLKAILPVHVYGQPADMERLLDTAREFNLALIEDACEALGATFKDQQVGTLGDSGVFAFYPNKQITTGEGGVVITGDEKAASLIRSLRNQGRAPGDSWLQHTHLGYNYRMDEMSAALGAAQLTRIDELLAKRSQVASWYIERLARIDGVETIRQSPTTTRMSWFVFVVRLEKGLSRDRIADALQDRGIPVRPYFLPIHLQQYMKDRFGYRAGDYPTTEDLGDRSLALPFSSVMSESQVDAVCQELADRVV